jgi:hypothetical protein
VIILPGSPGGWFWKWSGASFWGRRFFYGFIALFPKLVAVFAEYHHWLKRLKSELRFVTPKARSFFD